MRSRQFHFTSFQQSFVLGDLGKGIQQLDNHQFDPKYFKNQQSKPTNFEAIYKHLHLLVVETLDALFDFDENC